MALSLLIDLSNVLLAIDLPLDELPQRAADSPSHVRPRTA
jgi:hypothetical protein